MPAAATAATSSGRMPPDASVRIGRVSGLHPADGLAQLLDREVVEQHHVDRQAERLVELVERIDLHLDLHEVAGPGAGRR